MRFIGAVALALVMLWVPVDGVAQRNPLTGLTAMGHLVNVNWHDDISMSEAQFTQELETAFELGLLRTGVTMGEGGGGGTALFCEASLVAPTSGSEILDRNLVGAAMSVSLMEGVVLARAAISGNPLNFDEDVQIAETWRAVRAMLVGTNNLSGRDLGEWCAETFELAWRRANN